MAWGITRDKVLKRSEILQVLADLRRKARRSKNARMNMILFRLSTCCGLRASELTGLKVDNVRVGTARPCIKVPAAIAKNKKARTVPLIFDQGTLDDLRAWKQSRLEQGAKGTDLFLCSQGKRSFGHRIDRRTARKRFKTCCACLGKERQDEITIHHGRHSFISHALHAGRSIVEVKEAAGHSSLGTTSLYAHLVGDDDEKIGNLFGETGEAGT